MPKYIVNVDMDSPREEGEHIEKNFEKGIDAPDEHEAELIVDKWIKKQMYGGPYYSISEAEEYESWLDDGGEDADPAAGDAVKEDKPEAGKVYALTGGPGVRCIANGNSWSESALKDEE